MQYFFRIAGITICFDAEEPVKITDPFLPFVMELPDSEADLTAVARQTDTIALPERELIYNRGGFQVEDGRTDRRYFLQRRKTTDYVYGYVDYSSDGRCVEIRYLPGEESHVSDTRVFFYHLAWERQLLLRSSMILHACCIAAEPGGILFSGNPGVGKSTQGDLWCRYESARMINGDRTVLRPKDGGWWGYGSPYAGSSQCYVNEGVPIRAIVMLKQAPDNTIRRLGMAEACCLLYEQMTVNTWDKDFVIKVTQLITQLVQLVPVYELSCTPDRRAVELLKETLLKECGA